MGPRASSLLGPRGLRRFPSAALLVNSPERNTAGEQLQLGKGNVISADALGHAKQLGLSGVPVEAALLFISASHILCRFLFQLLILKTDLTRALLGLQRAASCSEGSSLHPALVLAGAEVPWMCAAAGKRALRSKDRAAGRAASKLGLAG